MIAIGNILMEFSPFFAQTANALELRRLPVVATTLSYRTCAMVEPSAYNGEARLSPRGKLTIGAVVFALGLFVGAAVAAWKIPPC
jgi:hypothetical protein